MTAPKSASLLLYAKRSLRESAPNPMPAVYDQILRALVWQAADLKDTWDGDQQTLAGSLYGQAIAEIVDTHARWPLVQYAIELRYARTVERRRRAWLADSVALMRDTYPAVQIEREAA